MEEKNVELLEKNQNIEHEKEKQEVDIEKFSKKEKFFVLFLIFLSALITLSVYWLYKNTGNLSLEQLIFHLKVPLKGTNTSMVWEYALWTTIRIFIILSLVWFIIYLFEQSKKLKKDTKKKILYIFSKTILVISIIGVLLVLDLYGFAKNQFTASTFIEEEYVNPFNVAITFPEEKQNLIYIYLESVENTFSSLENGGMYEEDRMPELTKIAQNNMNFSNSNKLGGAFNIVGTTWTIAAMVSQTSGLPLKITIDGNEYGNHSTFLPGACTLGEILENNGYTNYLLIGSESEFGGRKQYFESHGNYNIWDFNSAIQEERMLESEKVWWGYSDQDLFKYAKEQLTNISKKGEPFNYTMLTVDTHFTDGYVCENCDNYFEDQYSNVIRCSSKQVSEFVEWIENQPFAENTTIIISGDHITMQSSTQEEANEKGYGERTIYNAFINAKSEAKNTTNRQFFTMDMLPTTLSAIGAKIDGEKLGLGTNLFSDKQTLAEKYGIQYVRAELEKKSVFYNKKILYNQ